MKANIVYETVYGDISSCTNSGDSLELIQQKVLDDTSKGVLRIVSATPVIAFCAEEISVLLIHGASKKEIAQRYGKSVPALNAFIRANNIGPVAQ